MLDLDHFKHINDEHGHSGGDAVLRRTAQVLQAQLRADALLARYGGQVFVALVHVSDLSGARRIAERMCLGLEATTWPDTLPGLVKVTASLGVTLVASDASLERAQAQCRRGALPREEQWAQPGAGGTGRGLRGGSSPRRRLRDRRSGDHAVAVARTIGEPQARGDATMADATDLSRLVPGFDFLQGLMKNAGAALPGMSQWIAPTLNPEEIDKRIQELRTVQFWLEQNAKLLATTIQALEVQRMTLSTLQSMNLPMTDLRDALTIQRPAPSASPARAAAAPAPAPAPEPARPVASEAAAPPAIDPMQWWTALTQQFTELASKAIKDAKADGARPGPAPAGDPPVAKKSPKASPARAVGRKAGTASAAPRKRGA